MRSTDAHRRASAEWYRFPPDAGGAVSTARTSAPRRRSRAAQ
ncbi:hypothetical protein [Planotetraspora phitsanulokensis]|nr:hypothetical protein [Planotetraspora phitsanulokensis]